MMNNTTDKSINNLTNRACDRFVREFDMNPEIVVVAPGRVNLFGGHVDYNDGIVLPIAINRYTVVVGADSRTDESRVVSDAASPGQFWFSDRLGQASLGPARMDVENVHRTDPNQIGWWTYVLGVINEFRGAVEMEECDARFPNVNMVIDSDIPVGAGLSSSAALEVAVATFMEEFACHKLGPMKKAQLCKKVENRNVGIPCGLMDQATSAMARRGQLLKIDCQSETVDFLPWNSEQVEVLIMDTGVQHELANSEYAVRQKQCRSALAHLGCESFRELDIEKLTDCHDQLSPAEFNRAKHLVTELQRCITAATAIATSDWELAGQLMFECHDSIRDNFEVSCAELDFLVQRGKEMGQGPGLFGMRMTGGGFGGCCVAIVRKGAANEIARQLGNDYQGRFDRSLKSWVTTPSMGAHVILS